jgi:queuosine biosynthesis protein QueD
MTITISRRHEIDMAHCLPDHDAACHRLHGHRYAVEAVLEGAIHAEPGDPQRGMILDFGHLGAVMATVLNRYDHRCVMDVDDPRYAGARKLFGDDVIGLGGAPTAENLAAMWASMFAYELGTRGGNHGLAAVIVHETPRCRAEWTPDTW